MSLYPGAAEEREEYGDACCPRRRTVAVQRGIQYHMPACARAKHFPGGVLPAPPSPPVLDDDDYLFRRRGGTKTSLVAIRLLFSDIATMQ